ncbi:DEAD/DEAH box helicase [Streptomyces liangshanensis]|uniref:DEAD/DEAH box helicase n=1 Tax=Streptomyces liangshanensis TaxID=2717324 RepID=A0A6G9H460_9ACTN|nr:DEAD/DEAH box helicase [Streptomyces liangshanensis]QIQ05305.1 DEAD/DEAH box helicase [Streptomyces liangshanensis]
MERITHTAVRPSSRAPLPGGTAGAPSGAVSGPPSVLSSGVLSSSVPPGLTRCAAVFLPAGLPREGRVAFWAPEGDLPAWPDEDGTPPGPAGGTGAARGRARGDEITGRAERGEITVVRRGEDGRIDARPVPALVMPVADAVPLLARARRDRSAHPASACWGAAALHALQLAARGRLLPGLTASDHDAWRAGPLDADDIAQLRAIAAAMPPEAYAVPVADPEPGTGQEERVTGPGADPRGLSLPDPEALVRAFLDAVADALPRTPAAAFAAGKPFAARAAQHLPGARTWAAEAAAGMDAGVRVSLRLDLSAYDLFDTTGAGEEAADTAASRPGGPLTPRRADAGTGADPITRRAGAALVQVHSLADPTLVLDAGRLWAGDGDASFGPRARVDAMLALRRAARVWTPLGRLLERDVPDALSLSEDELYDLLGPAAARLAAAGVAVHWPRELVRSLTASAVVRAAPGSATDGTPFFDSAELLKFNWQVALDGDALTEREMDALAESTRPIVRLRDQWVVVDPALVRKARKRELGLLEPVDALAIALTGTAEVDGETVAAVPTGALAVLRDRLVAGPKAVPQPPALTATLRDYQLRGLAWLDLMTSLGLGGCLADDMGLGKTITVIALHLHRAHPAPTLVVCPASLLGNWQREITRFAPGVAVHRFHGAGRSLDEAGDGFVLTTYGTMRSSAAELAAHDWGMVVADEAQHVKNPFSSTAKALRTIPSPARIALTGTPVENNLSELWALLDWTTPGLLGPLKAFRSRHARIVENVENARAADVKDADNEQAVERLARLVRPFLLRRKKSDPGIVPELPPKTESDHPVALTREQASLYEAVVRETMAAIEAAEGIARRGLVMKLLTALKQICNHPAQYLKEDTARLTGRSGKLALLDELLDTILAEDGSVLVFTQYVSMARLLSAHLASRAIPSQLLNGGTPVAERERMVDRFQSGETPVFVLSLKAAGTGLNLTRAGHVVHFDRWWNPAVEEQATDRAYRIGQTQHVQVHRLIAEGTVEDRIAEMLQAKRALADAVLGSGEAALTELTDRELADLVSLRRQT